jgi:ligand-binding sensor domain-containing protein
VTFPLEKVMHIAMKHSAKKRKREGTLNAQTKRRYSAKKVERDALIQKRRRMRTRTAAAVKTENKVC